MSVYSHAYEFCQEMLSRLIDPGTGDILALIVPPELHKLQRLLYTSATLRCLIGNEHQGSLADYFVAIELATRIPATSGNALKVSFNDLVTATCFASLLIVHGPDAVIPPKILEILSTGDRTITSAIVTAPDFDVLDAVHCAGDELLGMLQNNSGHVHAPLLHPDQAARLPNALFPKSGGVLPGICAFNAKSGHLKLPSQDTQQQTNLITSTLLFTLAARVGNLAPGMCVHSIRPGISLSVLLYYLSLALEPTPSTFNNLGITLASLPNWRTFIDMKGERQIVTGHSLAREYYERGLQLDSAHPFLLTNLGSLLVDQGHVEDAIRSV
jgi:protein O-GlcNAc transferase